MHKRNMIRSGFTIVELLIVIVVIAILAAISVVAYTGMQQRAQTAARVSEMVAWEKAFQVYRAANGGWPPAINPDSYYCLGTGYPVGAGGVARCRDYMSSSTGYPESDSAALMSQLATMMTLPNATKTPVSNTVGPYIRVLSDRTIRITQVFPISIGTCPDGTTLEYTGWLALWCFIRLDP